MKNARLDKWKLLTAAVVWLAVGVTGFVYFYELNPERRIAEIISLDVAEEVGEKATQKIIADLNLLAQDPQAVVTAPEEIAGVPTSESARRNYQMDMGRQLEWAITMAKDYSTVYDDNGNAVISSVELTAKDLTFSEAARYSGSSYLNFGDRGDVFIRLPIQMEWKNGISSEKSGSEITDFGTSLRIDQITHEISNLAESY